VSAGEYVAIDPSNQVSAVISARCWFDADEFAKAQYVGCKVEARKIHHSVFDDTPREIAPGRKTVQEIAQEYTQSVERAAYMRGRKECAQEIIAHMEGLINSYTSNLSRVILHKAKEEIRKVFG
jgi:hypothetical protein